MTPDIESDRSADHNRLMGKIIDYVIPRLRAMGPVQDQLVLAESLVCAIVFSFSTKRDIALGIFDLLVDGVRDRVREKCEP